MSSHRSQSSFAANPWPYVIVGYFAVFIVAVVVFISWAVGQRVDLVRPDYYDAEVRHQEHIERVHRTRSVSAGLRVVCDPASQSLNIELPLEHARSKPSGEILLYRPSDARLDQQFALSVDEQGRQTVSTRDLRAGLWKVRLTWRANDDEFYYEQSVVVNYPGR